MNPEKPSGSKEKNQKQLKPDLKRVIDASPRAAWTRADALTS